MKALTCWTGPEGTRLASGSLDRTVRVWNPAELALWRRIQLGGLGRRRRRRVWGHTGGVAALTCWTGPEGTRLASGSDDRTVKVWDPATGELIDTITLGESVTSLTTGPGCVFVGTATGAAARFDLPDAQS